MRLFGWPRSISKKAFDKIFHDAVFQGLEQTHIDKCTISAIKRLYSDQSAYLDLGAGARSRTFQILRGVDKEILYLLQFLQIR